MSFAVRPSHRPVLGYSSEIADAVRSFTDPSSLGALIIGPAGIGKTTVLNAALAAAEESAPVVRLRGMDVLRSRPLGVLEILLSQAATRPELSPGAALSALGRNLRQRWPGRMPVILVDNANLVDDASVSVLTQLALARRVRLLVAAESIRRPVDLIADLWLSGDLRRIDLTGLDEAVVSMLRDSATRAPAAANSVAQLHAETGGNPLLLGQVLFGHDHLRATDRILWNIDSELRPVLEMIAMTGAIHYETLLRLCSAAGLDSLADAGIITMPRSRHASVQIVEPVVAASLRAQVRPAHGLSLWLGLRDVADLDTMEGQALFGYLSWGLSLGYRQPADKVLEAVAWANVQGNYDGAAELIEAAPEGGDELLLETVRAEAGRQGLVTAYRAFDRVLERVDTGWEQMDSRFLSRVACMDIRLTDPREPERLRAGWLREALGSAVDRGRCDVTLAAFDFEGGRFAAAKERAECIYLDHACLTRHRLRACAILGAAAVFTGQVDIGLKYIAQAELMFDLPGNTSFERDDAMPLLFVARYAAGDWIGARNSLSPENTSARLAEFVNALVDVRTGHTERALNVLGRSRPYREIAERIGLARTAGPAADYARALLGATCAERASAGAPGVSGGVPESWGVYSYWIDFESELFRLQTLALSNGEMAAERLYVLGGAARARGATTLAASAWLEAACLGHWAAIAELGRTAAEIEGGPGAMAGIVAAALVDGSPVALLASAQSAADYGDIVLARDLAKIAQSRAVDAHDQQAAKEARALIGTCLRTIRFSAPGPRLKAVLSDFERDLVEGVMSGRSSQELGKMKHLSARTIEWHLSRIYRRLHVANRRELREVIASWDEQE